MGIATRTAVYFSCPLARRVLKRKNSYAVRGAKGEVCGSVGKCEKKAGWCDWFHMSFCGRFCGVGTLSKSIESP